MSAGVLFYEELDRRGLTQDTLPWLLEWPPDEVWALVEHCAATIPSSGRLHGSPFEFVVNDQLSGMPAPCPGERCRVSNAIALGRFAALYADHIVIRHQFSKYFPAERSFVNIADGTTTTQPPPSRHDWPAWLRERLIIDLRVALYFRSLVDAGLASFTNVQNRYCPVCVYEAHKEQLGSPSMPGLTREWETRLVQIVQFLYDSYERLTTATLDRDRTAEGLELIVTGDETLVEHGEQRFRPLGLVETFADLMTQVPVRLTFEQLKESRALHAEIERVVDDMVSLEYHRSPRIPSYLTSRSLDKEVIDRFAMPSGLVGASQVRSLSHGLPYVEGLSLPELLKVRSDQHDAFQVYRDAISEVLRDNASAGQPELERALHDRVRPEINKLERSLGNNRRINAKNVAAEVLVTSGVLAIGHFAGFSFAATAAAASAITAARGTIGKAIDTLREPKEVLDNRYYFLWKASKRG